MKKNSTRLAVNIAEVVIGLTLAILGGTGVLDEFWSGMGVAVLVVGSLFLIRQIRMFRNPDFREKREIEENDERNQFIAGKAWAWAGVTYVMIACAGTIVLKILGQDDLMMLASGSVCLMLVLYWVFWLIIRRKY